MGLDMYLKSKHYLYAKDQEELKKELKTKLNTKYDPTSINLEIGYWRKANAIHQWFVNNVQEGHDNCQESYVNKSDLEELLADCKTVLNARSTPEAQAIAEENLPTQAGFFFGNTEYGDWYYDDLEHTIDILEDVLENIDFSRSSVFYQASW